MKVGELCKKSSALIFFISAGLLLCPTLITNAHAIAKLSEKGEALTLAQAIKKALAKNPALEQARIKLRLAEITYQNAWDTMFMPGSSLTLTSNQNYTFGHVPSHSGDDQDQALDNRGYPTGSAVLNLGKYTLFNFGKDYIVYQQAQLEWERQQELANEAVRAAKFAVTRDFFQAKTAQDKRDAVQRSVDIAQAIVELVESRVGLKKATPDDLSSAKIDLNTALNDRNLAETNRKKSLWTLNQSIGEPVDRQFSLIDLRKEKYKPIKIKTDELIKIYRENGPSLKELVKAAKVAELAVKLSEKERLPLPKVTFSGVNVAYGQSYYGVKADRFGTAAKNPNMDINAKVDLTIPITGPGGLFFNRTVETQQLNLEMAESVKAQGYNADIASIYQAVEELQDAQEAVKNTKASLENASSILNNLFKQVSHDFSSKRLEFRDAITQGRDSELAYNDAVLNHLTTKLNLATLIGVDQLPGDSEQ